MGPMGVSTRFNLEARWLPGPLLQAAFRGDADKARLASLFFLRGGFRVRGLGFRGLGI